ncbi:hypothetical protein [Novosphingobium sp. ZW T3_23]|uniref:hypothetical protein n=1 Tax=Novosphingobium sp. ZW T3_23 TaxID=3378084 RepID=UPI003853CFE4
MSAERNHVLGYINVWQGTSGHQWTDSQDGLPAVLDRRLADQVARDVEGASFGIRRVGVLHFRMKVAA